MFRKIFVLYPRGLQTGGPEALHQLVDALRAAGQDAVLVPRQGTADRTRVPAFEMYDAPEALAVEDSEDCAVVAPEDGLRALATFRRARRICWWLSIDHSSTFRERAILRNAWAGPAAGPLRRAKRRAMVPLGDTRKFITGETRLLREVDHMAQSQFAWSFVHSNLGTLPSLVSDYTPLEEFVGRPRLPIADRRRAVTYNPKKSEFVVSRLRPLLPDVEFIALENMTRHQVIEALESSIVYLDLGSHPGKDRMPREAALCETVTLVARRGSGALWADVPLGRDYKITPGVRMIEDAAEAIRAVLNEPVRAQTEQESYRQFVMSERSRFFAEVRRVFVLGQLGEDTAAA